MMLRIIAAVIVSGSVVGEGAATLVLKRLQDAIDSGDRGYAVIRGLGVAGGTDPGPNAEAYTRALERAYADARRAG